MAARTTRIFHDENTRKKIQASQLINCLTKHVLGKSEMSSTQVAAALGLLKKTLPDLAAQHNTNEKEKSFEDWLDELPPKSKKPNKTKR